MITRQMELGLQNQPGLKPAPHSRGRSNGAHWWFEHMRGIVSDARDWPPATPPTEEPRSPALQASSGPPQSEANPQSSGAAAPGTESKAPPASEPRRWKFGRSRRLIWE